MTEEERYATIQQQMGLIQETAITNPNPVKSLLSAMLLAEMYTRNERHHQRVMEARTAFIQTLYTRTQEMS